MHQICTNVSQIPRQTFKNLMFIIVLKDPSIIRENVYSYRIPNYKNSYLIFNSAKKNLKNYKIPI